MRRMKPKSGNGQGLKYLQTFPDSKVHGANMGPIWGRQDRFVQERRNSISNALELRLPCTNPSTCPFLLPKALNWTGNVYKTSKKCPVMCCDFSGCLDGWQRRILFCECLFVVYGWPATNVCTLTRHSRRGMATAFITRPPYWRTIIDIILLIIAIKREFKDIYS